MIINLYKHDNEDCQVTFNKINLIKKFWEARKSFLIQ